MLVEKRRAFIVNIVYYSLIATLIYLAIKYLLGILLPFIVGFGIATLLRRVTQLASKKTHLPQKIAAILVLVLFYIGLGFLLSWLGIRLVELIKDFLMGLPQVYASVIEPTINTLFTNVGKLAAELDPSTIQAIKDLSASLSGSIGSMISNISSTAIQGISSMASSIPSIFITIVITMISSLFFAIDYNKIMEFTNGKFPNKVNKYAEEIKALAVNIGAKYIKGYSLLMLITFVELSIGLSILSVDKSILVAVLIALIDILPVFGTGAVLIPWIAIELIGGDFPFAIGLAVVYVIITIVRNILEPKIIGEQLGIHPLIMLVSMFAGAKVFGFAGMITLPVCAVVIKYLYDHDKLHFDKDANK